MEPRDLVKVWDAPDNSKLTAKQWSIRLPVHVAAKITALCDIYPRKSKTEIISDLLATALNQVESALPCEEKVHGIHPDTGEEITSIVGGPLLTFRNLTEKYTKELEAELSK